MALTIAPAFRPRTGHTPGVFNDSGARNCASGLVFIPRACRSGALDVETYEKCRTMTNDEYRTAKQNFGLSMGGPGWTQQSGFDGAAQADVSCNKTKRRLESP